MRLPLSVLPASSFILFFCFINGFTGGFGICLGQYCGAKDENGMRKSIAVSTLLSIAFTVVLTLICCLSARMFLILMKVPSDIEDAAYAYMFVVLLGTGATVFYNMISNMLRALGDSKTPLYFLVFSGDQTAAFFSFLFSALWMSRITIRMARPARSVTVPGMTISRPPATSAIREYHFRSWIR